MLKAQKLTPNSPRILLVDDNTHGNVVRKMVLKELGFAVECALSGEEALEMFQREPFDLVITDLKMGLMSGLELIENLRRSEVEVRIILLSAWAVCLGLTEETSGADMVLAKSDREQEQLTRAVRQLLASRSKRKPAQAEKPRRTSVARFG